MNFNARLKDLLAEKGVTWKQVSQELSIGKNQPKYWEVNDILPDGKTLIKLSRFFGVSVDYLLGTESKNILTEQAEPISNIHNTTEAPFYERFESLCKERGLRPQSDEIVEMTGVSSPAITGWKKGSAPRADVLIRIATYFDVSIDYLLGMENKKGTFTEQTEVVSNKNNTYELFAKILELKGITAYRVAKDTGLTTVLFSDWKKGKSRPKYDKLKIIADYLGVSVEYLQGVDSKDKKILSNVGPSKNCELGAEYTEQEKTLLAMFRSTSEEGRLRIIQAVMNIRDEFTDQRTIYRAARSIQSDSTTVPTTETRSQHDMAKIARAKKVTKEEDL